MNAFADHLQIHTSSPTLMHTDTHTINVATLPGLTLPPCRVKKTSSQPFIPSSVFHFPILLVTHSSSLSLILSLSFFCSRPYFQPAWLTATPWRLQSEGPFVGTAFGGIKKGASTPSPPLLLSLPSPSTPPLSVLLGLIV